MWTKAILTKTECTTRSLWSFVQNEDHMQDLYLPSYLVLGSNLQGNRFPLIYKVERIWRLKMVKLCEANKTDVLWNKTKWNAIPKVIKCFLTIYSLNIYFQMYLVYIQDRTIKPFNVIRSYPVYMILSEYYWIFWFKQKMKF